MKVALLPAGNETIASTRMRVISLARSLEELNADYSIGDADGADVIFVQKRVDEKSLHELRRAKLRGARVIYDIDDLGQALWYWVPKELFAKVLEIADIVTTASKAQTSLLYHGYGIQNTTVWPNPIDYYPDGPVRPFLRQGRPLKVVWFGSAKNFRMATKYVDAITSVGDVELYAIGGAAVNAEFRREWPSVTFLDWTLKGFTSMLQSCDLACLMHDGSSIDRAKSNNKMTASITWGVPAIVSRTPAYADTAVEAGIERYVFDDEEDLIHAIEGLRSVEAREKYLDTAQPPIWELYSPLTIARGFLKLAESLQPEPPRTRLWSVVRSFLPSRVA